MQGKGTQLFADSLKAFLGGGTPTWIEAWRDIAFVLLKRILAESGGRGLNGDKGGAMRRAAKL